MDTISSTKKIVPHNYIMVGDYLPQFKKFGWATNWHDRQSQFNHYEFSRGEKFHCLAILTSCKNREDDTILAFAMNRYPSLKRIGECLEVTSSEAIAILNEYGENRSKTLGIGGDLIINPDKDPYFDPKTHEPTKPGIIDPSLVATDWAKGKKFTFPERGIPMGAVLTYTIDPSIKCTVIGNREVMYNGKPYPSLSYLTCILLGRRIGTASGTSFWKYNDTYVKNIV